MCETVPQMKDTQTKGATKMTAETTTTDTMTAKQREAYNAGWSDRVSGFSGAIKICKESAANGDENCAMYVKGYCTAGVGE